MSLRKVRLLNVAAVAVSLLLTPSLSLSQTLPQLPKASEITTGSFPNGADFYFVKNASVPGYADFALVRKGPEDVALLRGALDRLPHFQERPVDFLANAGVGCGPNGWINYGDGYQTIRFSGVPVHDKQVCDSTLLMLFDIMGLSADPQAVVISGDIDVSAIRERASLFSLMVAPLSGKGELPEKAWVPHDSLRVRVMRTQAEKTAAVNLTYSAPRISRTDLNTAVPVVTMVYALEMGDVISERMKTAFREADIPLADVRFDYGDSASDYGAERFRITVYVPSDRIEESVRLAGEVLGSLDRDGADGQEFLLARNKVSGKLEEKASFRSNAGMVDKCVASYLYGTNLSSEEDVCAQYCFRNLPADSEVALFNGFVSALLDRENNLVMRLDVPSSADVDAVSLAASFKRGWDSAGARQGHTAGIPQKPSLLRSSSVKETAEPVTGGTLWTFSNGVRVICRKLATPGEFSYSVSICGGRPVVPESASGETAFIEDMLPLMSFGGAGWNEIVRFAGMHGISLDAEVTMTSLRIYGKAPSDGCGTLFGILQALSSSDVRADEEGFRYYIRSEALREDMRRMFPRDVNAFSDDYMSTGYDFTDVKSPDRLGGDFIRKAEKYYGSRFSRINDGVILLAGDLNADALKKELPRLISGFGTAKGVTVRPKVVYPLTPGLFTKVDDAASGITGGKELGVNVAVSARLLFNNEDRMTFPVALEVLRAEIVGAMRDTGYSVEISGIEENYPKDRVAVFINCRPCPSAGLPEGVAPQDQLSVLSVLRAALEKLPDARIEKNDFKAYKALNTSRVAAGRTDPEVLADWVDARYTEGKDFATGALSTAESVTEDAVRIMLARLANSTFEYVIVTGPTENPKM